MITSIIAIFMIKELGVTGSGYRNRLNGMRIDLTVAKKGLDRVVTVKLTNYSKHNIMFAKYVELYRTLEFKEMVGKGEVHNCYNGYVVDADDTSSIAFSQLGPGQGISKSYKLSALSKTPVSRIRKIGCNFEIVRQRMPLTIVNEKGASVGKGYWHGHLISKWMKI